MGHGAGICDGFVSYVEGQPDAVALVWHDDTTSYAELYDLACRAGARLDQLDLGEDEPVGILAKKSPLAVALVLACLLSSRRFLLASPTLAERTLTQLFAQAGCRHVVSPEDALVGSDTPVPRTPLVPPVWVEARVEAADISFMLTTSGSTGLPKIVPLSRGAVDRFTRWAGERFELGPGKTVLNYAPLNFDLCLLDVWTTLRHGGRVVLVDPDHAANGAHLLDLLSRHDVNVVQAVPLLYRLLIDAAGDTTPALDTVRHVIFTGDSLPARTLAELPRLFGRARLYNIYGCTETNDSFIHEVDTAAGPAAAPLPLGRALPGVHAFVVGSDGIVLDGPGTGELYVSTPFQTEGYLDAARSVGRFVPHPHGHDQRRYFRTGDVVRRTPRGQIVLEGRNDFQVKVRGVAVNTAEIERVLLDHPQVVEAAVVAVPDDVAGHRLHAALRRHPASRLNSLALRQHSAERLPLAAIPSTFEIVDDPLPRTSTGKVDRRQLAEHSCASRARTEARTNARTKERCDDTRADHQGIRDRGVPA